MENKRFITVIVIIALVAILLPVINYFGSKEGKELMKKFNEALAAKDYTFIEIARDDCYHCEQQKPIIDGLVENYGLEYMYIDTTKLTATQLKSIIKTLGIEKTKFGTPTMAIIGNNEVKETMVGLNDEVALAEKLEEYNLIDEYGFTDLEEIDYDKYYSLLKSKKEVVILIEREGCSYCEMAAPQLRRASYLTGTKIYSLDIYDAFMGNYYPDQATEDQKKIAKKFMSSLDVYGEGFGTPLLLVVKKGKVVASYTNGYAEASVYVDFLKENKLSK